MSSSISKKYLQLYRSTVHPLLSIFIPFLFLVTLDQILRALFPILSFSSPVFNILLLITGIEEAVAGNILFKERANILARIREVAVIFLTVLLFLCIVNKIPLKGINLLRVDLVYPLILVLLQWTFSYSIHSSLRERETLLSALIGKKGSALLHALRDSSYQAGIFIRGMGNTKQVIATFQFVVFSLIVIAVVSGKNLGFFGISLAALHAICGLLFTSLINLIIDDQFLLGNGIIVTIRLERRRLIFIISLLGIGIFLVLLAARDASLLPLSYLLALLEKLGRLFRLTPDPRLIEGIRTMLGERRRYYDMRFSMGNEQVNHHFLRLITLIMEFLRRFLRTVIGAAIFFFLVAPLFSAYFLKKLGGLKPLELLLKKIRALTFFSLRLMMQFISWLSSVKRNKKLKREDERSDQVKALKGSAMSPKYGLGKKLQMGRVLKAFVGLLKWGERMGVRYLPFNTPQEYAARLGTAIPGINYQLIYVVELFEEVMFSEHLVRREKITRYFRAIKELRKGKNH